jgi:signal transduction histidine kinase
VQLVEIAGTAGEKMLRLITDYLDFAKIDGGYLRLERENGDLCALLRRAAVGVEPQVDLKRQTLRVSVPEGVVMADIDAPKLEQSLENLLSNATKYTPDGGSISLALESDGLRAWITVSDTGAGIDPAHQSSLFAKFHRLPGQATRAAGGTGLGLLIAKEIVEGHDGTISVKSTGVAGEGTTFTVELPRRMSSLRTK